MMNPAARGLATDSNSNARAEAGKVEKPKLGYGAKGPNTEWDLPWWMGSALLKVGSDGRPVWASANSQSVENEAKAEETSQASHGCVLSRKEALMFGPGHLQDLPWPSFVHHGLLLLLGTPPQLQPCSRVPDSYCTLPA